MNRLRITENEEYLRTKSAEVDFKNDDIAGFITSLRAYCKKEFVYALAPIQIGIAKRIVYIRNSKEDMTNNMDNTYNEEIIYINPEIVASRGKTCFLEGCYSCSFEEDGQDIYYTANILRPYEIDITYFDIKGNKLNKTLSGFEAVVFSHEYDHLNGIFHMDRADKIYEMTIEEMKDYRTSHPYKIISKDGNFQYEER